MTSFCWHKLFHRKQFHVFFFGKLQIVDPIEIVATEGKFWIISERIMDFKNLDFSV